MQGEPGKRTLAELSQHTGMLAAVAALHALVIFLLASTSLGSRSRVDTSVLEAQVIALEQPKPLPPPAPLPTLPASSAIEVRPLEIEFELPAEPLPATASADEGDLLDGHLPVTAGALPEADPAPAVGPRPISGPRGADRYPNASLKAKESGTVLMRICVSPEGTVDSVQLARSSGFPRLDQVALGIASEYRFQPAMRHGRPIAACLNCYITFKVT